MKTGPTASEHELAELRQREQYFHRIFAHSNDAIFVIDPENDRIVDANSRACALLGYTREELLQMRSSDAHPHELPALRAFAQNVLAHGSGWTNELSCLAKGGVKVPVEMSVSVVEMDGRRCLIGMVRDISERRAAEQALRESEQRFQTLARVSPAIIFRAAVDGQCLYVNERWTELTGLPTAAALGFGWNKAMHPDDVERSLAEWRLATQQGAVWKSEFRVRHLDGTTFWLWGQAAPERDAQGQIIAYVGAAVDITDLKRVGQLQLENTYLKEEVRETGVFGDIVGSSPALNNVLRQIELVAPTDASVLILGDSGTGKELVAREIHRRSRRADHPLIRVNCASIPKELYESEFFGHVKGAFTGAIKDRAGRFEAADGGTLFLDEIGEIPSELQSKLLRVLQEGQYERLGEERTRTVNVRLIAATNRDLKAEVAVGRFRQDLFYRLNVFPVEVAPLRDRKEDIPSLAAHFLGAAAKRLAKPLPRLTQAGIMQLQSYEWPGNIRELQNVIERAVILSRRGELYFDLPKSSGSSPDAVPARTTTAANADTLEIIPEVEMRRRERENLLAALNKTNWQIAGAGGAAELLGMKPTTLASRIKAFGLARKVH